jgi:myo-inositol-1-phosphate synthase
VIRLAIAGIGNCASSLVEGIAFYRQHPDNTSGLLFPRLPGHAVADIDVVAAFDVSQAKVGRPLREAIHQAPNQFVRIAGVDVDNETIVQRAPTLDGNPPHLAQFVHESAAPPVDVAGALRATRSEVLINLLPTGSVEASAHYARAALDAGCAFVNCIPTVLAQRTEMQALFRARKVPILGDDIKSQLGTTIVHRTLLGMIRLRGARLVSTSQINVGGNTDFANFVHRAETKLASKRKSMASLVGDAACHVGHHYDLTKGPFKHALIEIDATVFGGSAVSVSVKLESDDKPNSAGSVVDLIRIARSALDAGVGGVIPEACALYMKSSPVDMDEYDALARIERNWMGDRC